MTKTPALLHDKRWIVKFLPTSHFFPVYPGLHTHLYELTPSIQEILFLHGDGLHSLISAGGQIEINKITLN